MAATMLGQGLYDASEVGWLLGHDAEWVVRWGTDSSAGPAIISPTFDRLFSFADLVSFRVGLIIRQQGVSDRHLRRGAETLRSRTGLAKPLASRDVIASLATSGDSFLSDLGTGEFEDIGRGGQGVFQEVVRVHLTRITFDVDGGPERWVPAEGVVIDPAIQAGAPCISGTRVPTATVAALLTEEDPEDVATASTSPSKRCSWRNGSSSSWLTGWGLPRDDDPGGSDATSSTSGPRPPTRRKTCVRRRTEPPRSRVACSVVRSGEISTRTPKLSGSRSWDP